MISIITVSYNSAKTIVDTLESVLLQSFDNYEYLIIDGASVDGTIDIIKTYEKKFKGRLKIVSEPDKGIYDAMNKGIKLAIGDVVGILNSDDFFSDRDILEVISQHFRNGVDAVYGDVQFVNPKNIKKLVRYYSSKNFRPDKFKYGFMPAHPSFYVRREIFDKFGYYKENYKIAADYELLLRFLSLNKIKSTYIERSFVTMRTGGVSNKSLKSRYILNREILQACKENNVITNIFNIYSKYFIKIFEFFTFRRYNGK